MKNEYTAIVKQEDEIVLLVGLACLALVFFATMTEAAGFREQGNWQFDTPMDKAIKLQMATTRQLYKGGYFDGSHANKSIYIGDVNVREVSGNMQWTDQSNTNIGNYQEVVQSGNGTLNVEGSQDSGDQSGLNTSHQQGAGDIGGDSAYGHSDYLLNVGASQ